MTATLTEYDRLVALMVERKVPREKAEEAARRELGLTIESQELSDAARTLEKTEQQECIRIYLAHGCVVSSTSQYRPAKISAGLPDLLVFAPKVHAFWMHEVKRSVGGVQSPAQREFQHRCEECGVRYVLGDRTAAWQTLRETGVI